MTLKERYAGVIGWFEANMPVAESELQYKDPYQLLVAVILSAQCTDKRVNMTTPALFEAYPTPEAMAQKAIEYMAETMREAGSFKVETRRADKAFPMTSIEVSQYVGGELAEAYPECRVDVHEPELVVHVEIRDLAAYVHAAPTPGAGGMPVGSNGIGVTLLSGGIDSPVAAYRMAKRGLALDHIHFASPPYTSERAKLKVKALALSLIHI